MNHNICLDTKVWDLHIHTNLCSKSTGDFKKLNTTEYIDQIIDVFDKFDDLEMISFTDHNRINIEVYDEFISKNHRIHLLPGIEIDVDFGDAQKSKHLLVYFNDEKTKLNLIADEVNKIMDEYNVSDATPIKIYDLTKELIDKKLQFLYSPHAFKQRPRDISSDWIDPDSNDRASKYTDQFICFWETAGLKDIENARQFLNEFLKGKEISIVSFSDSSNLSDITKYLSAPTVFFSSLSTFRGVQMVGSDSSRISFSNNKLSADEKSKYIGMIKFNDNSIYLSNKLNTIIGGRGSGKSILLDSIGKTLGKRKDNDDYKERNEYLAGYNLEIFDLNDKPIGYEYHIDYYDQSYVTKIFTSKDRNKRIESYFNREFDAIESIDIETVLFTIKTTYSDFLEEFKAEIITDNIGNVTSIYKFIPDNSMNIKILRQDLPKNNFIESFSVEKQSVEIRKSSIIPKEIVKKNIVHNAIIAFQEKIIDEIEVHNIEVLNTTYLTNRIFNNFLNYKSSRSAESKAKEKLRILIKTTLSNKLSKHSNRYNIINSIIKISDLNYRIVARKMNDESISISNFEFTKELVIENPLEYFVRVFDKYVSGNAYPHKKVIGNLEKLILTYCTDIEKYINESKKLEDMDKELLMLDLKCEPKNCIYYKKMNIDKESPGTQTNILMEYIVNSSTSIPLLIDQPEDNIDNKQIYNELTKWISKLKYRRQIIMVTHDANIVINADSENVIISEQVKTGEFKYIHGALEYGDNIMEASYILDGGSEAVRRRLNKYGK